MNAKDFAKRVNKMCDFIKKHEYDDMSEQLKPFVQHYGGLNAVFAYSAWCEKNFESNLREDYKRKTTYTSDFSIAEWCVPIEGMKTIASTLQKALMNWRDSIEFFAEIIMVLNLKSWEHAARGNNKYGAMYAELYYQVKDLYFDWFDKSNPKHDEAIWYYYDYVD